MTMVCTRVVRQGADASANSFARQRGALRGGLLRDKLAPVEFIGDRYSHAERQRREARAERTLWRRHIRWLRRFHWTAQVVIVIGEVALAYTLFVAGMVLGVVLALSVLSPG
jgi:hypothetical protein